MSFIVIGLWLATAEHLSAEPLPALGAEPDNVSVSGVSSGGYMAHQLHIAHSRSIVGAALFAAGPYYCANGGYPWNVSPATNYCMDLDDGTRFYGPPPAAASRWAVQTEAARGCIDSPRYLRNDRVFLFSGLADNTVPQAVVDTLVTLYSTWLAPDNIVYIDDKQAGHGFITDTGEAACEITRSPYINNCDLDGAGLLLQHIYGDLRPPVAADPAALRSFDQAAFTDGSPKRISLAARGYVYLPQACRSSNGAGCRLHVALHGCRQYAEAVGDAFYRGAGYNAWAEANALVILYPQTTAKTHWYNPWWPNPRGCWDWWGYTGADYHVKTGPQIAAIWHMVERLTGRE